MAARKNDHETNLHLYYQARIEALTKRLIDIAEAPFSNESIQQHREFEDRVERRLQNGAKFIPRKRQPR
jgi:hypothetical protein